MRRLPVRIAVAAVALLLQACVFLPRSTAVYDEDCQMEARHMVLEMQQVGYFGGCANDGCAMLLVAAGVVTAATAVVSGSIVVAGNIVYWFERRTTCGR
jgi:hypothetical protein